MSPDLLNRIMAAIRAAGFDREAAAVEQAVLSAERAAAFRSAAQLCDEHETERHLWRACSVAATWLDRQAHVEDDRLDDRDAEVARHVGAFERWSAHELRFGELYAARVEQRRRAVAGGAA